ncbi:MAG: hypothetical protein AAFQ67_06440, partial [Pseudomonadota bacterium]
PMFRHFGQDPTPAEIMRERAPAVYEWVARMWNAKPDPAGAHLIDVVDPPLEALLSEVCETHLSQLRQNAGAYGAGKARYDQTVQNCAYVNVPVSRYRVWCLEELRRAWAQLNAAAQDQLKRRLKSSEAEVFWNQTEIAPSNYDTDRAAPFNRAINVFGRGVPPR